MEICQRHYLWPVILASEVLSLPMGPQLSLDQVQDIVNALKNA